ncbi:30S ribosomal protein [Vigna angularis]|uniref:30S ribosomal protein n=1 Tax=Phaseolus angularis TaxID=3914 RepID=A0A8T0KS28_PHAAN|nr:30S ribosomal protein [Vigna angularis]
MASFDGVKAPTSVRGVEASRRKAKVCDEFEERVVQIRRVTKVVKGGKQLRFRAVVIVDDKKGQVDVGVSKAKEVVVAVQKSASNARRNIAKVPMTKYSTFPHRCVQDYQTKSLWASNAVLDACWYTCK